MDYKDVITVIMIPAFLGLSVVIFKQGQQSAIVKTDIGYIKQDIQYIKQSIAEVKGLVNLFLKQEVDSLKELAKRPGS